MKVALCFVLSLSESKQFTAVNNFNIILVSVQSSNCDANFFEFMFTGEKEDCHQVNLISKLTKKVNYLYLHEKKNNSQCIDKFSC